MINFEMPTQAEDYVHRIGRTGRAGAEGVAISLMDETEQKMYQEIKKLTGNELPISRIEGFEPRWENAVAQSVSGSQKSENSPEKASRYSHQNSPRQNETVVPDMPKIPNRPSRRRRRERQTCALFQRNFGAM